MAVDVTTSIDIDCPRGEVFEFTADPSNAPTWYVNIESIEWLTDPPVRVGSQADFVAQFLGRRLAYMYEVIALEPGALMVMSTSQGPFPMETTYSFEDLPGGGTLMTLRNRGRPTGFVGVAAPLMMAAIRRANRKDLALLKRVLEGRG